MWTKTISAAARHERFFLLTGILFVSTVAWATNAIAAAPAVFSAWDRITYTQDVCLQRAETDLRNNGFTGGGTGLKGTHTTIYGFNGEYTGQVRCFAGDLGIVYFIVAGPSSDMASSYIDALRKGL